MNALKLSCVACAAAALTLGCAVRLGPVAWAIGSAGVRNCEGYTADYDAGVWVREECTGRLEDVYGGELGAEAARAIGGAAAAARRGVGSVVGVPTP